MGLGWFSKDTGDAVKSAGEGIGTVVDSATGLLGGIRNLITGDLPPDTIEALQKLALEAESLKVDALKVKQNIQIGQQTIEKAAIEKGGFNSFFLAGWRPSLGWIAAIALFAYYVPPVALQTYFWARASFASDSMIVWQNMFDVTDILGLVGTLLGMAGLRSLDKKNGSQGNH